MPAGDQEFIAEMINGFAIAFMTGILLMYAVLVLLFRSFAYPVTITQVRIWAAGLQARGLQLAPASALAHR